MKIKKSQPYCSGSMLDFVSAETDSGLIIHDLRLMSGRNGPWVAMPSKPQVDRNGTPRRNVSGRAMFSPIVEFRSRQIGDQFRQEVLAAVRRDRPDLLKRGRIMIDASEASIRAVPALLVSEADALGDCCVWLARRPDRLFRARAGNDGGWLIRRRRQGADPDVCLRTSHATQSRKSDADSELNVLWYAAPYPDGPIERCRKWARTVSAQHRARHGCNGRA